MPTTLLKRDSHTGAFLRILRISQEYLFYITPLLVASDNGNIDPK